MRYNPNDILDLATTNWTHIQTTNGEFIDTYYAWTIDVTSQIHLRNCLFIPSWSHKLLSNNQLAMKLNCNFFFNVFSSVLCRMLKENKLFDVLLERGVLYCVGEATLKGYPMLVYRFVKQQLWMWHRHIRYSSLRYWKKNLFPLLKPLKM